MLCREKMFIFGIFKLYISNFSYYNLYQRELKAITRKKYVIDFLIQSLDFSLEIREDESNLHGFPKKNLEAVSKMNDILFPRNYFQFPFVKIIVSKIAYIKLENTKHENFFTQSHRKVVREIFQGLRMDHIDQKVDRTDQGYQSHQLLNESDV